MGLSIASLSVLGTLLGAATPTDSANSREYQIKAAFIYNFTKFIEWSPQHLTTADEPITIAIFGDPSFGEELKRIVTNRNVNGRSIAVKIAKSTDDVSDVELAFLMRNEEDEQVEALLEKMHKAGVVTVGESSRFRQLGGMIVFVLDGDKVRFEIDMRSAERAGLKISAQLQKLARTVRRSP